MTQPAIAFVIPAHGRYAISRLSFAGIRWTLDELAAHEIDARALILAEDENLDIAAEHGFDVLETPNSPLGRRWNNGYEHACAAGADFVIACGSDDWVHPDLVVAHLAAHREDVPNAIHCSRRSVVVAPDGREAVAITVGYPGGDGVRMLPRRILERVGFRPTLDDRHRAIDGGMAVNLVAAGIRVEWVYTDLFPFQILDFKSDENLTEYRQFPRCEHSPQLIADPLADLGEYYPSWLVEKAELLFAGAALVVH